MPLLDHPHSTPSLPGKLGFKSSIGGFPASVAAGLGARPDVACIGLLHRDLPFSLRLEAIETGFSDAVLTLG